MLVSELPVPYVIKPMLSSVGHVRQSRNMLALNTVGFRSILTGILVLVSSPSLPPRHVKESLLTDRSPPDTGQDKTGQAYIENRYNSDFSAHWNNSAWITKPTGQLDEGSIWERIGMETFFLATYHNAAQHVNEIIQAAGRMFPLKTVTPSHYPHHALTLKPSIGSTIQPPNDLDMAITGPQLLTENTWNMAMTTEMPIFRGLLEGEFERHQQSAVWLPLLKFICTQDDLSQGEKPSISTPLGQPKLTLKTDKSSQPMLSLFKRLGSTLLFSSNGPDISTLALMLVCIISCALYWLELMHSSRLQLRLAQLIPQLIKLQSDHQNAIQREQDIRHAEKSYHQQQLKEEIEAWNCKLEKDRHLANQRLEEVQHDAIRMLEEEKLLHEAALSEALREHENELELLTSSHAESSRTLRHHLHTTRNAMQRVIGSVEGFRKQVLTQVTEVKQLVFHINNSLQAQTTDLAQLRRNAKEAKEAYLMASCRQAQKHADELMSLHQTSVEGIEQLRVSMEAQVFETSRQHERHIADLTSSYESQAESINIRLAGFRAASKRYKARAEQAFSDVGHSIKARLGNVMDIASSHAQNHKERIQILEDQLAAALSRGNELRQHVKELQVGIQSRDDEISDHLSSLEILVERLNKADSLLRIKEDQLRHDRELRDGLQRSIQEAEEREGGLEVKVQEIEASLHTQEELANRYEGQVAELQALVQAQEQKLAEVPQYLERMRQAKERIKEFMERMRGGQQQLEDLQSEIQSRDKLLIELREEMEHERLNASVRERQNETTWEAREQQAKAEVNAKMQELRHRMGDIEVLKEELRKVKDEVKVLRKPRSALPTESRALQQLSHNNNSFKR